TTQSQGVAGQGGAASVDTNTGFGPGSAGSDAATLGSSAVALTQTALSQPDVRTEKVGQLRNQISAGTYQVSPSQVAAAMLADPLTGLGSITRD
ncbi:MAG: flagellar biosynthesis anti-sigma factor FlgM, partial [Terriglobales bacterium]